ncbi:hypothetical protein OE88DRAFT_1735631 [Heliocybe sulcata]|uniref:Uncharacterized protein n=1 Tax=Heliocybe sulcata TaxID=5364 RepID=A0A5C3N0T4_9AGAM|nr:hypothetical protein OE88DRAFT_1735631 [Heliocybe sulcata]
MQHWVPNTFAPHPSDPMPNAPSNAAPAPAPEPHTKPFHTTFAGTLTSAPNPGTAAPKFPFAAAATERKAAQQDYLQDDIRKKAFDPATKIHQAAFEKMKSVPEPKRKQSQAASRKDAKLKATAPPVSKKQKVEKMLKCTLVLIEDTPAIDNGSYRFLNKNKMTRLYLSGNVRPLTIADTASAIELDEAVKAAFADHPDVTSGICDLDGWRHLVQISSGKGKTAQFVIGKSAGVVKPWDWGLTRDTHRQARYSQAIYIALQRDSPKMYLANPVMQQDDSDEDDHDDGDNDGSSQDDYPDSDGEGASPSASGKQRSKSDYVRSESKNEHGRHDQPAKPMQANAKAERTFDSPVRQLVRLTHNLKRPSTFASWWPVTPKPPYDIINAELQTFASKFSLLSLADQDWVKLSLMKIVEDTHEKLYPKLHFLVELYTLLGNSTVIAEGSDISTEKFERQFLLGPCGLAPLISFLEQLLTAIIDHHGQFEAIWVEREIAAINRYTDPLLRLLQHFCTITNRVDFDPAGFADLRGVLRTGRNRFLDADDAVYLRIARIEIEADSIEFIKTTVLQEFGTDRDPARIDDASLLLGPLGLDGFMQHVIDPLLDSLPTSHANYEELMKFFRTFCGAVAHKMTNVKKSTGRSKPSSDSHAASLDSGDSTKSEGGYGTRSKSRGNPKSKSS